MNTEQVLTSINILLTSATFLVGYLTYRFNKKKDYEDKIFNMKFETYSKLNELCFNAFNKLNPNNSPLVEIYDYKDKDKWTKYYEKEVMKMDEIALEIERVIMKSSFYLPSETLNPALEFSQYCIKYITQYAHFDTELNCNSHDKIFQLYLTLLKEIRSDLKIDNLNSSMMQRIESRV